MPAEAWSPNCLCKPCDGLGYGVQGLGILCACFLVAWKVRDARRAVRRREVVGALPREYYLARSRMERFNVAEELRQMRSAEARRHYDSLTIPPLGLVERKCPYGAPLPVKKSRPKKANLQAMPLSQSQPILPSAGEAKKRFPGLLLLDIPYDPTTLPNEHDDRIRAIDGQIAEKELFLEKSDSEAAQRMRQSFSAKAPDFKFDHVPDGTISENASQARGGTVSLQADARKCTMPVLSSKSRAPRGHRLRQGPKSWKAFEGGKNFWKQGLRHVAQHVVL